MNLVIKNILYTLGITLLNLVIIVLAYKLGYCSLYFIISDSLVITLIYFISNYFYLYKPLIQIYGALKVIDFSENSVDLTKLDSLRINNSYKEIKEIESKFKYLLNIINERINAVNSEIYKSEHDELTGCYNRVHLEKVKSSYEMSDCYVICFIDVNNLKRMNDEFGHEAGDSLLRTASRHIQYWNSIADVYRIGGDEFMIVFKNKPLSRVNLLINDWYKTVGILNRASDGFRCVLSYGLALGVEHRKFEDTMREADNNMYSMKVAIKRKFGESLR